MGSSRKHRNLASGRAGANSNRTDSRGDGVAGARDGALRDPAGATGARRLEPRRSSQLSQMSFSVYRFSSGSTSLKSCASGQIGDGFRYPWSPPTVTAARTSPFARRPARCSTAAAVTPWRKVAQEWSWRTPCQGAQDMASRLPVLRIPSTAWCPETIVMPGCSPGTGGASCGATAAPTSYRPRARSLRSRCRGPRRRCSTSRCCPG